MSGFLKDPQAVLDYAWDWTAWLSAGETIASFSVQPVDGITIDSTSLTASVVTAWISGGTVGTRYRLTCRITTSAGRTDDRSIYVTVVDR